MQPGGGADNAGAAETPRRQADRTDQEEKGAAAGKVAAGRFAWAARHGDLWLVLVASVCAVLFVSNLGRLWPLVPANLHVTPATREAWARKFLERQGFPLRGYVANSALDVDEARLDFLEREFGPARTAAFIRAGAPLVSYLVAFKRLDSPVSFFVTLRPDGQVMGWRRAQPEDEPGGRLTSDAARDLARNALRDDLGLNPGDWREVGASERDYLSRLDRVYVFERTLYVSPPLKERASVRVAGDRVMGAARALVVPPVAERNAKRAAASRELLMSAGTLLLGGAALGAFGVFLLRLRDGSARLRRAALWSGAVFVCTLAASLLRPSEAFALWDPLWPRPVSFLRYVIGLVQAEVWTLLILVAVVAAGDALDRARGDGRGESLWRLTQGKVVDPLVGAAAARGFLVGLICAGVMAGAVLLLQQWVGARAAFQPRGFFFYALNSPLPGLCTLLYFLRIALLEELGYRYFAGTWLLTVTRRKWLAILLPALVYGLTHTSLSFLPPAEPFWARPLVMTLVGCVWGWAYFRYDALTVVISHLTADLFIFNWPRLASGEPGIMLSAGLTVIVPVLPALGLLLVLHRRAREGRAARRTLKGAEGSTS